MLLASLADQHPGGDQASSAAGLCVALSGGLDSTVLLVALAEARQRRLVAAAARTTRRSRPAPRLRGVDRVIARRLAAASSIPFESVRIDARAGRGESPEAAARAARYAALVCSTATGEVLLTAHHADDQLETVLLQWLRGGGLHALAGMPALARFGVDAWHARPLLPFTRQELLAWANRGTCDGWKTRPTPTFGLIATICARSTARAASAVARGCTDRCPGRALRDRGVEAEQTVAVQDLAECAMGATLDFAALARPVGPQGSEPYCGPGSGCWACRCRLRDRSRCYDATHSLPPAIAFRPSTGRARSCIAIATVCMHRRARGRLVDRRLGCRDARALHSVAAVCARVAADDQARGCQRRDCRGLVRRRTARGRRAFHSRGRRTSPTITQVVSGARRAAVAPR